MSERTVNVSFCRRGYSVAALLGLTLVLLATTPAAFGQASSGTASISGVVSDATGGVMAGADVEVRNVGTNVVRTLKSNEVGRFESLALPRAAVVSQAPVLRGTP